MSLAQENQISLGSIPTQKTSSKLITVLSLVLLLVFISVLALGAGFLLGKLAFLSRTNKDKTTTTSAKLSNQTGKNVYTDKVNQFQLNYPDGWTATKTSSAIPGALIKEESASVEIWLTVDRPFTLNSEQKEALVTTNELTLKIGSKTAKMTEYVYTFGGYFAIAKLTASSDHPQVTFWIKAENQEKYSQAKVVAQSFSFN